MPDGFWKGKRVLLTGHTGFKGSWLSLLLLRGGADVAGLGLRPTSSPNLFSLLRLSENVRSFFVDLRSKEDVFECFKTISPEIVIHMGAQSLVGRGYETPVETFSTNVLGTAHILEACRTGSVRSVVSVTSDKAYQNVGDGKRFVESDPLGGVDPYSSSKSCADLVTLSYRKSFLEKAEVAVASARAGNVIGGGDWAEDRLVPDAVRAWEMGGCLQVRQPDFIRPWQHVLDPLVGYMALAKALFMKEDLDAAYNFGPLPESCTNVKSVVEKGNQVFGRGTIEWGNGGGFGEASVLALDASKAADDLGVNPRWDLEESIERTFHWYRRFAEGASPEVLCQRDIEEFEQS